MDTLLKAVDKLKKIDYTNLQKHMGQFQEDAEVVDVKICDSGCIKMDL